MPPPALRLTGQRCLPASPPEITVSNPARGKFALPRIIGESMVELK